MLIMKFTHQERESEGGEEVNQSMKERKKDRKKKQGRIHGQYQLRTGGQGRKCAISHFPNSIITDQLTDRRTNGRTELRVRN